MTLGDFIKEYREKNRYSQREFAKLTGLTNGYISMLENDRNPQSGKPIKPSISVYRSVASAVGISMGELMEVVDDDEAFLQDIMDRVRPLEAAGDKVDALNVFLAEIGENIIRVDGNYFLGECGMLSDDDIDFMKDAALSGVRMAFETLKKRAEKEMRDSLSGAAVEADK